MLKDSADIVASNLLKPRVMGDQELNIRIFRATTNFPRVGTLKVKNYYYGNCKQLALNNLFVQKMVKLMILFSFVQRIVKIEY